MQMVSLYLHRHANHNNSRSHNKKMQRYQFYMRVDLKNNNAGSCSIKIPRQNNNRVLVWNINAPLFTSLVLVDIFIYLNSMTALSLKDIYIWRISNNNVNRPQDRLYKQRRHSVFTFLFPFELLVSCMRIMNGCAILSMYD